MLKSLELFGFKSFADRTLFEFSPGVTCVVGPNGSGKSNVVDAIKWILGDQSAKSLRGKEMADVIFNGSAGRRASGFAEATLTFDNSSGLLPIDAKEVQIGRRLYQSGDSEYLLNRSVVRLKDVKDMFMGTGAGTAAYSIIEQGRVDQILQANPTTRRLVFEEAAGISKFKSRRIDAERRLERVAQNLLRLTDIVDEVETQLNSTRSQASKAARYRELSAELTGLWTGLAADDFRHLSAQLEEYIAELELLSATLGDLHQQIGNIDQEKQELEGQIASFDDELMTRERRIAAARESLAAHESTIRHQSSRRREIEGELRRQRTQRAALIRRVDFARGELMATEGRLRAFEEQCQSSQEDLAERDSQVAELRALAESRRTVIASAREEATAVERTRQELTERLVVLDSQTAAIKEERERAQSRLEQAEVALQGAHAERLNRQRLLTEAEAGQRQAQERFDELQAKRTGLLHQRDETEQQLNHLRERRSAAQARLGVLEEIEERQDGIAIGVRDILHRAETSRYPPWNRVLGLVRDLLEVPLDLAPIIEAALGERAQLIALAELEPMLDYLNRGPAPIEGRVGFVAIEQGRRSADAASEVQDTSGVDLSEHEGVFGRADRLVTEAPRAAGLASRVLSDTWIVDHLDGARRLMGTAPPGTRFVTLQGEVLCDDEQLFVGTVPHESSIVSRKSELRSLKNEILQLNKNIDATTQRQAILGDSLESRDEELVSASEELKVHAAAVTEATTRLAGQNLELDRLESEFRRQLGDLDELDRKEAGLMANAAQFREKLTAADESSHQLRGHLHDEQQLLAQIDASLAETLQTLKVGQVELAKHEERLTALRQTQIRLDQDQQQRRQQLDDVQQQTAAIRDSLRRCDFDVLAAQSAIAGLTLEMEEILQESRILRDEREHLRQRRSSLAAISEERHREARKASDRQRQLEFETQKLQHQLTTLAQRILEEFQTPLTELVASGASAYRLFLVERYGEDEVERFESSVEQGHADVDNRTVDPPAFTEIRDELEARVDRLRRKIKAMGNVNTEALESLEELEERYATLSHQLKDLQGAKGTLEDIIRRINGESERIFMSTFETIRQHFQELFRKLFGGGDADMILEDPSDVLECGIDIVARPPGKELRSISLLSGGEKTMTAVAMLFAMFKSKPSPYCILDEVDAALDDANVDRYATVLKEFVQMTQFVVITHRKRTMTAANVLYGVTMEQAGVSKRMSVRFEDVSDNGEIRSAA